MAAFSLPLLSSIVTWRNAAILFALLNLKNLPFVWHLRLLWHLSRNSTQVDRVRRSIPRHPGPTHPIFAPVSIYSRAPLLETDYNLHKSNSTFFTDLDVSRTALATKLLQPGMREGAAKLEKEGYKGRVNAILGSVHCSYHKEIYPYEKYEIRSRVLGWDKKWLLIGSWFIRPGKKASEDEQILASALSKYVIKKGRYTVTPEAALQSSGWLPERPVPKPPIGHLLDHSEASSPDVTVTDSAPPLVDEAEIPRRRDMDSPFRQESATGGNPIVAPIPEHPLKQATTIQHLEDAALKGSGGPAKSRNKTEVWDWYRIDAERERGMELANGWLALDRALFEEGARVQRS